MLIAFWINEAFRIMLISVNSRMHVVPASFNSIEVVWSLLEICMQFGDAVYLKRPVTRNPILLMQIHDGPYLFHIELFIFLIIYTKYMQPIENQLCMQIKYRNKFFDFIWIFHLHIFSHSNNASNCRGNSLNSP